VAEREAYDELPSTQDRAIELARAGAAEGTRVVARRQTGGRGRLDHGWVSPAGGLYLSIVLATPASSSSLLPLGLGARLLESFRDRYGAPVALKWPNDLLVVSSTGPARKLGGILVDRVASPTLGSAAVAGIGINVAWARAAVPPELAGRVASLGEFVRPPPELAVLESEVSSVALGAARSLSTLDGAESVRRLCRELLYGVGRWASVDGRLRGKIAGLGDDGELWIDAGTDRVAIRAGDLRVEERP
jgi:BirA family transcriptional regulator, biotin operon repressor / biotin---[acetyl-CoA-carboxylase] ligase